MSSGNQFASAVPRKRKKGPGGEKEKKRIGNFHRKEKTLPQAKKKRGKGNIGKAQEKKKGKWGRFIPQAS